MEKKYTCPMHPEVVSDQPGKCPKCGMDLVSRSELSDQRSDMTSESEKGLGKLTWRNYIPLATIIILIIGVAKAISFNDFLAGNFSIFKFIEYFMIGFFLVFGGFKLLDLKGFAEGYRMYDLLAMRLPVYGYVYPFIELFFGFAMILGLAQTPVLWAEVIVMSFSGLGVLIKILKREKFKCVCLGTTLKVPLTTVTLIEDFGMATLALLLLFS